MRFFDPAMQAAFGSAQRPEQELRRAPSTCTSSFSITNPRSTLNAGLLAPKSRYVGSMQVGACGAGRIHPGGGHRA